MSIVLLILGIIIRGIADLSLVLTDYSTQEAYALLMKKSGTLTTLATLFLQLGMVIFSLSTFLGAVRDTTLSVEVRKGMAAASAIGILALGIMMITIVSFPW
ncbi:MAG: hypothetical protein KAW66_02770 [Candidatus Lokiarchaeota archaeon]|nr:hypothetical protein [Candidatus Lokiarchaeota archaeon]